MVIKRARKVMKGPYGDHGFFVFVGLLMVLLTLTKLFGHLEFSSDWFWFIAGLGLTVEGIIMLKKERKFNKKYRVVLREK